MRGRYAPVLVVAFAARVLAGVASGSTEGGDASEYLRLAGNLADGHGFSFATAAPFTATDWRPPGYPAVIVPAHWLGSAHFWFVLVNALLGTAAVSAIVLIARELFADRPRLQLATGLVAALYPSAVTFTGLVLSENLLYAGGGWFIYLAFFAPWAKQRPAIWLGALLVASSALSLARTEGVVVAVIGIVLAARLRGMRLPIALVAAACVIVAPIAWAARNDAAVGRFELTDPLYRDANLLLSVNHGDASDPLFLTGVALARDGRASATRRAVYHKAVRHRISDALSHSLGSVLSFKAKGLLNFFFVPPVWNWAIERFSNNYTLGDALRHLGPRNVIRLLWSFALLVQYGLAVIGLRQWWRRREYAAVAAIVIYPLVTLALTVPFQADPREWSFAALLLLIPTIEGASSLLRREVPVAFRSDRPVPVA